MQLERTPGIAEFFQALPDASYVEVCHADHGFVGLRALEEDLVVELAPDGDIPKFEDPQRRQALELKWAEREEFSIKDDGAVDCSEVAFWQGRDLVEGARDLDCGCCHQDRQRLMPELSAGACDMPRKEA